MIQGQLSAEEKCLVPKELVVVVKERSKTPPVSQELNKQIKNDDVEIYEEVFTGVSGCASHSVQDPS